MYHETKLIDGILHYRTTPNGEWLPCYCPSPFAVAAAALELCSVEERKTLFLTYCAFCGNEDKKCTCAEGIA